jgi:hypothetical protein
VTLRHFPCLSIFSHLLSRVVRHMAYECFDSTISTKSAVLAERGRLVVSLPQPDCLFSAAASCQQVPNPKAARDVCLGAVFGHPCGCSAYLRVGGVVLQQDGGSQDWLDAFHAVGDVAPVRNHSCDSANDSCDGDWIRSVTIFLTKSLEGERADHAACGFERVGPPASLSSIVGRWNFYAVPVL